jgi:hypothetical protein
VIIPVARIIGLHQNGRHAKPKEAKLWKYAIVWGPVKLDFVHALFLFFLTFFEQPESFSQTAHEKRWKGTPPKPLKIRIKN